MNRKTRTNSKANSARSTRPSGSPESTAALDATAGSFAFDGGLTIARHADESESLAVTHGFDPSVGLVTGLHIRGDLILGHTPVSSSDAACGFLTVAGGVSCSTPPALVIDGALQSPPRANMLFVLRGAASAGMIALWSGHLIGDGALSLHNGSRCSRTVNRAGAIGAFFGPGLVIEPFGCDAVGDDAARANARLPSRVEYGRLTIDMGVVLRQSTLRLRIGPTDATGRRSDRLICAGTLHLGRSTLQISAAWTSLPRNLPIGHEFTLIEAGSISGELGRVDLPALLDGRRLELRRSDTAITLRVVAL